VVGALFLLAILIAPVFAIVPAAATAPALIVVGYLMCQQITRIDFMKIGTGLPAFVLLLGVPLTYSITHGIGYGFITYVLINLATHRGRDMHPPHVRDRARLRRIFRFRVTAVTGVACPQHVVIISPRASYSAAGQIVSPSS
jgi:xanthine/uracil/vitamin C permease (AzgA family)